MWLKIETKCRQRTQTRPYWSAGSAKRLSVIVLGATSHHFDTSTASLYPVILTEYDIYRISSIKSSLQSSKTTTTKSLSQTRFLSQTFHDQQILSSSALIELLSSVLLFTVRPYLLYIWRTAKSLPAFLNQQLEDDRVKLPTFIVCFCLWQLKSSLSSGTEPDRTELDRAGPLSIVRRLNI